MAGPFRHFGELVTAGVVSAVLLASVVPMAAADRDRSRRGKDAEQIRQIHQALTIWANAHDGEYPLPSTVDIANFTISAPSTAQRTKDNTGNIFSLLIYNGLLTPEMMVSPAEVNSTIRVDTGYQYSNPVRAAAPAQALWDPGFAATPNDRAGTRRVTGVGGCSYAHALPFLQKRAQWTDGTRDVAIVANRGPRYDGVNIADEGPSPSAGWRLVAGALGAGSNTLRFYPARSTWAGNVLYRDGRVNFSTRADPVDATYRRVGSGQPTPVPDNLFVNENDDVTRPSEASPGSLAGDNAYLRLISDVTGSDASGSTVSAFLD